MECYACEQEAKKRCQRCGASYCKDHGGKLCAQCLDPANAAPSNLVFRVSLFALLGGSVLALWLLIRPPSLPGETSAVVQPTLPPAAAPTIVPTASPAASPAASPVATEAPTPTPAPTDTPAPTPIEYVIQEGDNVASIAEAYGMSYLDLLAVNGLTEEEAQILHAGDVIVIPQP